jgi:signal transduction histidine kinase
VSLRQRSLYAGLLVTCLVVTAALVWSGWRLVAQQRELDARQVRQDAEAAADALVAAIREALVTQGDKLSARLDTLGNSTRLPADDVVVMRHVHGWHATTTAGLPFVPGASAETRANRVFAEAEVAEFTSGLLTVAVQRYRALAHHRDAGVRAGALARLARVQRKRGDTDGALAAATALAALGKQDTDGIPAALAGLDAQRLALMQRGDTAGARRVADEMRQHLDNGAWPLDRGTAEFYRDEVSDAPRPDSWVLAAALADAWDAHGDSSLPARGLDVVTSPSRPVIVAWRASTSAAVWTVAFAEQFLPSVVSDRVQWRLADADDHHVAGETDGPPPGSIERVIGGGSSWTLRVWPEPGAPVSSSGRERMLVLATGGTVLFVWAAAALMARALMREARVAQLQSDFVAAVSHEFRSPLTTMRQMAELLETDRVLEETRRKQYYRMLAGETARLQHLVERLLDFGRMEAGRDELRKTRLDVDSLVTDIVDEMQETARARGGRIEVVHTGAPVHVEGDAQSLSLALRNLVENAVKYSPQSPAVIVRIGHAGGRVSIAVNDSGVGIDRDEQRVIFGKFVRGRAAAVNGVRGTGVGLATVKHVVDAHGGEIRVESEPGHGSTFTVSLPLDHPADAGSSSTTEGWEA